MWVKQRFPSFNPWHHNANLRRMTVNCTLNSGFAKKTQACCDNFNIYWLGKSQIGVGEALFSRFKPTYLMVELHFAMLQLFKQLDGSTIKHSQVAMCRLLYFCHSFSWAPNALWSTFPWLRKITMLSMGKLTNFLWPCSIAMLT